MRMMFKSLVLLAIAMAFGTASGALAQSSYKIQPGDALQVEVLEDPNLNRTVLVLPDGSISFPLVGSIKASGRSIDSLSSSLASGLASNFNTQPTVFVSLQALAPPPVATVPVPVVGPTVDVYVMGEVVAQGKIAAAEGTTLLQILAEAGGLTRFAARKRIELRREDRATGNVRKYLYNYDGTGVSIRGNTVLGAGDVIVVPARRLFE
ncbi:polysaccharide biosynthesis/export family protein [Roseovarius arcticus]|uniref:polysaccharide biosynthesis/export family protein n=1 Tax=Roseovarius arcticus TaxID=2547404 RepID=UPI001110B41D|nr:polysaccharide biosynthesis/export family protein [Roseovarius arcticus]